MTATGRRLSGDVDEEMVQVLFARIVLSWNLFFFKFQNSRLFFFVFAWEKMRLLSVCKYESLTQGIKKDVRLIILTDSSFFFFSGYFIFIFLFSSYYYFFIFFFFILLILLLYPSLSSLSFLFLFFFRLLFRVSSSWYKHLYWRNSCTCLLHIAVHLLTSLTFTNIYIHVLPFICSYRTLVKITMIICEFESTTKTKIEGKKKLLSTLPYKVVQINSSKYW